MKITELPNSMCFIIRIYLINQKTQAQYVISISKGYLVWHNWTRTMGKYIGSFIILTSYIYTKIYELKIYRKKGRL